jgi:hypothetical protein
MDFTATCAIQTASIATPNNCGYVHSGEKGPIEPGSTAFILSDNFWCYALPQGSPYEATDNPTCATTVQNIVGGTVTRGLRHVWGSYAACPASWFNQGVLFKIQVVINSSNYTSVSFAGLPIPGGGTGVQPETDCVASKVFLMNPEWPISSRFAFDVVNLTDKVGPMLPLEIYQSTDLVNWSSLAYLPASYFANNEKKFRVVVAGLIPPPEKRFYKAMPVAQGVDCCSHTIGFVNVTAQGTNKFTLPARSLVFGDQRVSTLMKGANNGTSVQKWDPVNQVWSVNNYAFGQWSDPDMTVSHGEGFFVQNPGPDYLVRFMGHVATAPIQLRTDFVSPQFHLIGSKVPLQYLLSNSGIPVINGSTVYEYNEATQNYDTSVYWGGAWNPNLTLKVGNGFFVELGHGNSWQQSLTIPCNH